MISVRRPAEEVFAPACLASFEGMPVTDGHPSAPEGVTAENSRFLQKGHAHNVRRGAAPEDDLLLADLIITEPHLIGEILDGKREISCGYNYVLCREGGEYLQREIRGNHVAVVDAGRAGPRVSIRDHRKRAARPAGPASSHSSLSERSTPMNRKNHWRAKLMARMARDGDVESLAEMITELMDGPGADLPESAVSATLSPAAVPAGAAAEDPLAIARAVAEGAASAAPAAVPEAPVVVEAPADQPVLVDCGPELLSALNRIIELLSAGRGADCGGPACRQDEAPAEQPAAAEAAEAAVRTAEAAENAAEAAAEAAEATAEAVAGAAAEAMGIAAEANAAGDDDPVEGLVAEILEAREPDAAPGDADQAEILSAVLEPEDAADADDPEENESARAADALRAALAAFRPQLKRMNPAERQRFNADVAARMKKLSRAADGLSGVAALRESAARGRDARALGQRIMAGRNVNLKH